MDIPVKVINLSRSAGRRESFIRDNPGLAYEFFEAVDGRTLTEKHLDASGLFVPPLAFPSMGAYGAALSHLKLWDMAIESGRPVTVAEDDAVFRADFAQASADILARMPDGWDFVLWGWNFDSVLSVLAMRGVSPVVMLFGQDVLRQNIDAFRKMTDVPAALGLDRCFGLPAYTISPAGARRFRQQCFPVRDFSLWFPVLNKHIRNTGIDLAMAKIYADTNSYVSFPPLVVTRNDHGISTIQQ